MLFVVACADVMAGRAGGVPGDVEPSVAGEQLVGERVTAEEIYEGLEAGGVLRAYVGGLSEQVLRVADAAHAPVHLSVAEAGVDDDGAYLLAGGFEQEAAAVGEVGHVLRRGDIVGMPV